MSRKFLFIIFCAMALVLGIQTHSMYAQKGQEVPAEEQSRLTIESKLDEVLKNTKENKEITSKLDRILSNQEKIFQELAIIKIRASKR